MNPTSRARGLTRALTALCLTLSTALFTAACGGASSRPSASLDTAVPISLPREDGSPAALPVPGARAVVLDFWSPTCPPCKRVIPAMLAKRDELAAKGAVHVLVAVLEPDESIENARTVLTLWGIDEPFLVDRGGAYMSRLGAKDVPAFAVLDSAGVLRWVAPDGITVKDVLAAIP